MNNLMARLQGKPYSVRRALFMLVVVVIIGAPMVWVWRTYGLYVFGIVAAIGALAVTILEAAFSKGNKAKSSDDPTP